MNKALKKEESPNVPAEVKERHEQIQEKPTVADTQEEADALRTPPDPSIPSGVLSIIVHQINNRGYFDASELVLTANSGI